MSYLNQVDLSLTGAPKKSGATSPINNNQEDGASVFLQATGAVYSDNSATIAGNLTFDEDVAKAQTEPNSSSPQENLNNIINSLYGSSVEELVNAKDNIINSTTIASVKGAKAFGKAMGKNYSGKYASTATIDFAEKIWGKEKLNDMGINSDSYLYAYENKQKASADNAPKVGDIVFMGENGDPYHNGVVVAITDDGKYIVQEANSAKADKGGALVAYTLEPADGHSKHIQSFISMSEVEETEEQKPETEEQISQTEEENDQTQDTVQEDNPVSAGYDEQKYNELMNTLYGDSVENLLASSGATNANPLVSSVSGGAKGYSEKMSEFTGEDVKYADKYASNATYDLAKALWGEKYLADNGITRDMNLNNYNNSQNIDENNTPKIGDIVLMGEDGDPYHNGVVVGFTDDGKYVVQEANSARAKDGNSKGGALVIYDTKPSDGRTKYIKGYIPLNKDDSSKTDSSNPFVISAADTELDIEEPTDNSAFDISAADTELDIEEPTDNSAFDISAADTELDIDGNLDYDVMPADTEAQNEDVVENSDGIDGNFFFDITAADTETDTETVTQDQNEAVTTEENPTLFSQSDLQILSSYTDDYVTGVTLDNNQLRIFDSEGAYIINSDGKISLYDSNGDQTDVKANGNDAESTMQLAFDLQQQGASHTMMYTLMSILGLSSNRSISEERFSELASDKGYSVTNNSGVPTIKFNNFIIELVDGQLQFRLD